MKSAMMSHLQQAGARPSRDTPPGRAITAAAPAGGTAKKPRRPVAEAIDYIAAQRAKHRSRTAAREAWAFVSGEVIGGPARPLPRDTLHAIELGYDGPAIAELRRRGMIWG